MAANERVPGEAKRFLLTCDDCSFSREVSGRSEAERAGLDHSTGRDHEVLAVEIPL
jgi:hypothetical protein